MQNAKSQTTFIHGFALNLFLFASLSITPFYSFESVNLPKFVLLVIFGSIALIYFLRNLKNILSKIGLLSKLFLIGFSSCLVLSFVASDTPWAQQLYGREGRRNGALTFLSLLLVFVIYHEINFEKFRKNFSNKIAISGVFMVAYSFLQLMNLDFFKWESVNLHFFGTLGNPNFLSAFLAIVTVPLLIQINELFHKLPKPLIFIVLIFVLTFITYLIIRTKSYQGYIALGASIFTFSLVWIYKNRNKLIFIIFALTGTIVALITLAGVLKQGPLSNILYKGSVTSRGDFFRAAFNMGSAHPLSGLGFDSFGDYYLKYRDMKAGTRIGAEYTDSAHNYFLDIFANFGLIAVSLYIGLTILVFIKFINLIKLNKFDKYNTSIFSIWIGFEIQSFVSPTNLLFLILNFAISGFILGKQSVDKEKIIEKSQLINVCLGVILGLVLVISPIQREHLILAANQQASVEKLVSALEKFPKSTTGYNRTLLLFDQNNLSRESLKVARNALEFNYRTYTAYVVVITSPFTSREEKIKAYKILRSLDPKNPKLESLSPFES